MMIISIYQYSWSLFAYSIKRELNWNLATVSLTFTIFAYSATFVQPFSGIVADTYGPRKIAILASFLVGLGFVLSSFVSLPWQLYLSYGLGGLGVGVLYGVSTATAIKWFPDKRGFAVGLVVFGFGAGTAIFNWIIQALLEKEGFQNTFLFLGLAMLISLIPLSLFYKYPSNNWDTLSSENRTENAKAIIQCKPLEMLRTYQWYLMYFSFAFTASIVLMFGAQMKMLAKEFAIPENYFSILLVIFPLGNGFSRIVSGAVSDKIGREKTMMIFYGSLGLTIISLVSLGRIPLIFIVAVFLAALLGGCPFALYPAAIGDYYGSKFFTTNYGITYTAKALAGLFAGWFSGYLVIRFGSYKIALMIVAASCLLAGLLSSPKLMKPPAKQKATY